MRQSGHTIKGVFMPDRPEPTGPDFSQKMTDILNYGALNLAMAIGYRTRLFDVMDKFESPQPVAVIAARTGLNGRYVKEWLGVMVSGNIVELTQDSAGTELYFLPEAHGNLITRRAGHSNLGVYTQEIPLLTNCAMEPVLTGFYTGDGVTYDNYPQFHQFMGQLASAKHRQVLVDTFLPAVDGGRLIKRLNAGIRVCDLGCAEGIALMLMAEAFPKSEFVGIDISDEALAKAESETECKGYKNIKFFKLDAAALDSNLQLAESFDYVTAFDAIHDQTRPLGALKGARAVLKTGGLFSMVDIAAGSHLNENKDHPMGPFLYTVSLMHCMPVGLVEGGMGLGMMWGRQKAVNMLRAAGFEEVAVSEIPQDPFNLHFLCRK
jgi:ubiquinone/menaquinone biosynthesis C-methylase UbiE